MKFGRRLTRWRDLVKNRISDSELLNKVLVLTTRKSFWSSVQCQIFPNRIYANFIIKGPGRFGSDRNPINMVTLFIRGYHYLLKFKPKIILFGSAPRVSSWFSRLKKYGFLDDVKLIAAGALYLSDQDSKFIDILYVFSRDEINTHHPEIWNKYRFIPLPADGDFTNLEPPNEGEPYIFSGGGAGRDYSPVIEAVRKMDLPLKIITFSSDSLAYQGELPRNCEVYWKMPINSFLNLMAGARFVVIPLIEGKHPHGHTTIVQAIRMGKSVITTNDASVDDYIIDGYNGMKVEAGNIQAYRNAIKKLWNDNELRQVYEMGAKEKSGILTYDSFANSLVNLCHQAWVIE